MFYKFFILPYNRFKLVALNMKTQELFLFFKYVEAEHESRSRIAVWTIKMLRLQLRITHTIIVVPISNIALSRKAIFYNI
jgi:hypothetical protein